MSVQRMIVGPRAEVFALFMLGQGIGFSVTGELDIWAVLFAFLWSRMGVVAIQIINASRDARANRIATADRMQKLAIAMIAVMVGLYLVWMGLYSWVSGLTAMLLTLLLAGIYYLPPMRLRYYGGGEIVEMLALGIGVPVVSAYLRAEHQLPIVAVTSLFPFGLLALAAALNRRWFSLHEDRRLGKATLPSRLAPRRVVVFLAGLFGFAALLFGSHAINYSYMPIVFPILAALLCVYYAYAFYQNRNTVGDVVQRLPLRDMASRALVITALVYAAGWAVGGM